MKRAMVMPRKYIQGDGVLNDIAQYVSLLGKKPLILWGENAKRETYDAISGSLNDAGMDFIEVHFPGESFKEFAVQTARYAQEQGADVVIGAGGGKAIDTAKGAAYFAGLPVIIVPTIVSTDAPVTSTAGWYNEDGVMVEILAAPFNPDILLVDTGVIARSPRRLFISGMGDAITTWIESDAAYRSRCASTNRTGALSTMATRSIARLCYDTLLEYGEEAITCLDNQIVTPLFEDVVETMVLHSGMGGESGGIAAAHSIANNLPWFDECKQCYHGEMVAFGVVVQLVLENAQPQKEIYRITDFLSRVGLPVTLGDLHIKDISKERLESFAQYCIESDVSFFQAMIAPVTQKDLYGAIIAANDLGGRRKKTCGVPQKILPAAASDI